MALLSWTGPLEKMEKSGRAPAADKARLCHCQARRVARPAVHSLAPRRRLLLRAACCVVDCALARGFSDAHGRPAAAQLPARRKVAIAQAPGSMMGMRARSQSRAPPPCWNLSSGLRAGVGGRRSVWGRTKHTTASRIAAAGGVSQALSAAACTAAPAPATPVDSKQRRRRAPPVRGGRHCALQCSRPALPRAHPIADVKWNGPTESVKVQCSKAIPPGQLRQNPSTIAMRVWHRAVAPSPPQTSICMSAPDAAKS